MAALIYVQVVASVDIALLDACFYDACELPGRDMSQIPHPLVVDTQARLKDLTSSTTVVLIHLNHTNPLWQTDSAQAAAVLKTGLNIGQQGGIYKL